MSIARKFTKSKQCYQVTYTYKDMELGELVSQVDYVKDLHGLIDYMRDMEKEHHIVDTVHFRCREDIIIKIKQIYVPEKKFISLFS